MQMWHGFATVGTIVDHESVTRFFEPDFLRDFRSFEQQMTECLMIGSGRFCNARDGFFGDDQDVGRSLRRDVLECEHEVVLVNDLRWNFAGDDSFK